MKNQFAIIAALAVVLTVLGCSSINPLGGEKASNSAANSSANKTLTDKAVDTTVGESKIGVPECDEVVDMLTGWANDPNDNFVVKAGKAMIANKIKEAVKTSVEENKTDKEQLAKDCRELKTELEKAMKEQQEKATQ
jgi:hypothetical protein